MVLLVFSLCGFASAILTRALDPLISVIARDFAIPVTQAALLSSALTLPFAFGQPFLGLLGDFFGKSKVLTICLWVAGLALAISAFAPTFLLLLIARPITGFAAGGIVPVAMAMVGDRFPPAKRQLAIARFVMVATMGQIVGASGSGILAEYIGWRGVLGLTAVFIRAMVEFR